MDCNEALQIVVEGNHKDRNEALTFILRNQKCLQRVDQLARAILSDVAYELSCAESRLHIATYYEWQHNQGETFPLLPDVRTHLERCPYCQQEYQILQETLASEPLSIEIRSTAHTFDLSFIDAPLPTVTPTAAIWKVEQQIRKLFEQIQISITETKATIAALTPQLAPVPFATAMRGSGDVRGNETDTQFAILVLPDIEAKIHLQIETKPSRDGTALITLKVFDTEHDQAIANARVSLRSGDGSLIASSLTGTNGEITFPRIPADRYIIQAHYQDKTWELPISIVRTQS